MMSDTPADAYGSLEFNSPMTGASAQILVAELSTANPSVVTDIGCGWAELLLRLLAACPDATGLGIDSDNDAIDRAVRNAAERSILTRVRFQSSLTELDASDLVICIGSDHVFGTLAQALSDLWALVRPGGQLLLGTLCWERTPPEDLARQFDEVPELTQLLAQASSAGWRPLGLRVATVDEWDHFEFGFLGDWEQVVMTASADEAVDALRAADDYRESYLRRRGILGFAFVTLGRPRFPLPFDEADEMATDLR